MSAINYRGLSIPFTSMGGGSVTSDNLFGPNEQVIFDFYEVNKARYWRALDVGANIGVHSILMARQGWEVRAFEPDPVHYARLLENAAAHDVIVEAENVAVSDHSGTGVFVRVLDNTTGSHLAGAKDSYGPRERFAVGLVDCRPLFAWADFAKIDCEGHEDVLVCATDAATWARMDALLEVGTNTNARCIYNHLIDLVPMWSQKTGWRRVHAIADMPICHQDGSLFVGESPPFSTASRVSERSCL